MSKTRFRCAILKISDPAFRKLYPELLQTFLHIVKYILTHYPFTNNTVFPPLVYGNIPIPPKNP